MPERDSDWMSQSPARWPCIVKDPEKWRCELESRMKIAAFKQLKSFSWKLK